MYQNGLKMSRIGKMPVLIPDGVFVSVTADSLEVKGPKGVLSFPVPESISINIDAGVANMVVSGKGRSVRSLHGLYRAMFNNAVVGVFSGFEKRLELSGVGYQVQVKSGKVELYVGYSKPVIFDVPVGITVTLTDSTHMTVSGVDKQAVGQFAATIRAARVPDPYKAKGVKYAGEYVKRKAGKAFGAGAK